MKKHIGGKAIALLLTAAMVVTAVPASVFAETGNGEEIIEEIEGEGTIEDIPQEDDNAELNALQDEIDSLPEVDELEDMSDEELEEIYEQVLILYNAVDELSDEDYEKLDISKLDEVAEFFTRDTAEWKYDGVVVSTEGELITAIENADGTEDKPTEIFLENDIELTQTLTITGKFVSIKPDTKVTDGRFKITAADSFDASEYRMIIVGDGSEATYFSAENIDFIASAREDNKYAVMLTNANSDIYLENCMLTGGYSANVTHGAGAMIFGTATMDNVEICNNYGWRCGGLYTQAGADVLFKNGSVHDNSISYDYAGGLYVNGTGHLEVRNSKIYNNSATSGSAVFSAGVVELYNSEIYGNEKSTSVIYVTNWGSDNTLILSDCNFHDNLAGATDVKYISLSADSDGLVLSGDTKLNLTENVLSSISVKNLGENANIKTIAPNGATIKALGSYVLDETDLAAFESTTEGNAFYLDKTNNLIKSGTAYTLTLNANYENATDEPVVITCAGTTLSADTFTREGYVFVGWNTEEDGAGTAYSDGAEITLSENTTLYAQWKDAITDSGHLDNANKVEWSFDEKTGILVIKGKGDITPFEKVEDRPYHNYRGKITSVDVSKFDTSEVTDMAYMFSGFNNVTSLDLSNFDTSKVTDMHNMFSGMTKLERLDLSSFDTSKVTDMHNMFSGMTKLERLDLSSFDTSNVTNMNRMFHTCKAKSINLSSFNTSNVTDMVMMFFRCGAETLDVSKFDTSKANIQQMFQECEQLKSLDLSNFSLANTTGLNSMFYHCYALKELNLSGFDTKNVTTMAAMFWGCTSLETLDLSHFNTSNVTTMNSMFRSCYSLKDLNISSFDTSKVTDMVWLFGNDNTSKLDRMATLDLSHLTIGSETKVDSMFVNYNTLEKVYFGENNLNTKITLPFNSCDMSKTPLAEIPAKTAIPAGSGEYKKAHVIDITFKENGGANGENTQRTIAGDIVLNENTFTRDGFTFVGWKVNNTGDLIDDKATVSFSEDTILYAQWRQIVPTSGVCGDPSVHNGEDVTWAFDEATGTLTISGTGAMDDWTYSWDEQNDNPAPWDTFRSEIKHVNLGTDITKIGRFSFIKTAIEGTLDFSENKKLTYIGERAFSICGGVTKVVLPESLISTGSAAFSGMDSLTDVDLSRCIELTTLGGETFSYCPLITSIDLMNCSSLTTVGANCFYADGLTEIELPANVKTIGTGAFTKNKIAQVDFSGLSNLEAIGDQSFSHMKELEVFKINNCSGLKSIGGYLFICNDNEVSELHSVIITQCPDIVITSNAFDSINTPNTIVFYTDIDSFSSNKIAIAVTDGGTFPEGTVFEAGKLAEPEKENMTFMGWFEKDADGNLTDSAVTDAEAGKTYYAKFVDTVLPEIVSIESYDGDYDGALHTFKVTAEDGATVTYSVDGRKYTANEYKFKLPGEYTVYYKVHKDGCTDDLTGRAVVKINMLAYPVVISANKTSIKGGGTVTLTVQADGALKESDVVVNGISCSDSEITVEGENGVYTATLPNKTASYTFTVDTEELPFYYEEGTAECTVEVSKKSASSGSSSSLPNKTTGTKTDSKVTAEVTAMDSPLTTQSVPATKDELLKADKAADKADVTLVATVGTIDELPGRLAMVSVPVTKDMLKKTEDEGNLTLAKVNPDGTLTYFGGELNEDKDMLTAYVDESGLFVVVDKDDLLQIKLTINEETITVNDKAKTIDTAPMIINDRTMVPLRFVAENLGAEVMWDEATKTVSILLDGKLLTMTIGQEIPGFGVAPVVINDRTMVPISYVSVSFGANVMWNHVTREVYIVK